MKFIKTLMCCGLLLAATAGNTQVGIGTTLPDTSAVLDISSSVKGLLMPRLSTSQRDAIYRPAKGLMIYNTTAGAPEINNGTALVPAWSPLGSGGSGSSLISSVDSAGDMTITSLTDTLIAGMSLQPPAGTYLVFFNAQYGAAVSAPISTEQGVIDLVAAYNQLMAIPVTNTTHAAVIGSETLSPGVYSIAGAASTAGIINLDGGGNPDALFIFRSGGAFNTGAGTTINLINGAAARNVFWIAEGALGLGAGTFMKGTLIAHNAAPSAAAGCEIIGRLFTTAGAVSFGPGIITVPTGISPYVNFGVLASFAMFTSAGAVANTGASTINGDVGSNAGAITGFGTFNGNIYAPGLAPNPINNTLATFSIYSNGIFVPNTSRTTDVNTSVIALQGVAKVIAGQKIDIRWRVDAGPLTIGSRILSLIKMN
ncbi:MAG: ice-binding family protein [Chitinophagaceae bacterium]